MVKEVRANCLFNMDSKEFMENKHLRKQEKNEIIIDIDDPSENGYKCLSETAIGLVNAGYKIELWYADGMKEPHIHIKDIPHLADLSLEEGKKYRILFFEKYIPKEYWNVKIPDYSLANPYEDKYHPIAEENKPHHKYGTIKKIRSVFNEDKQNFCENELYEQAKQIINKDVKRILNNNSETLSGKIAAKISILGLADSFGLEPKGKKLRVCPFHADRNPSLSLDDERGLFHCFGCNVSGNIIKFYAMLKKLKGGKKIIWNNKN